MGLIWWILPALAGAVGLMLSFAGLGRLLKLRLAAGGVRFLFGVGFLGMAGITTLAGLNMQTFKRLTMEQEVAHIIFDAVDGVDNAYMVTLKLTDGEVRALPEAVEGVDTQYFIGDEFSIGAQVITFEPVAQMLGYDSVYRLDFLEGRSTARYNTESVSQATSTGLKLYENPGIDVYALAKEQGQRFGISTSQQKQKFGSAVYAPMADNLEYKLVMTQSALVLEPVNAAASRALGQTEE